jgi:hypothetical protein
MHAVRTLKILGLAVAVGGMMFLPAVAAASAGGGSPATAEGVPAFGHVFVIIGENTGLDQVNKTDMPFLSAPSNRARPGSPTTPGSLTSPRPVFRMITCQGPAR